MVCCKQRVPHVGRECWEQVVVFAHALVELAECIELCCGDLDNSRVPVPPPRKAVGLKAGDDFVDVKAAHAEAAPVARRGAQQLHPDELDAAVRVPGPRLLGHAGSGGRSCSSRVRHRDGTSRGAKTGHLPQRRCGGSCVVPCTPGGREARPRPMSVNTGCWKYCTQGCRCTHVPCAVS